MPCTWLFSAKCKHTIFYTEILTKNVGLRSVFMSETFQVISVHIAQALAQVFNI